MSLRGLVQGCTQEGQAPPVTEAWNFIDYKPVVAVRGSADVLFARESCAKIIGYGPFGCLEARRLSLAKMLFGSYVEFSAMLQGVFRGSSCTTLSQILLATARCMDSWIGIAITVP